MTTMSLAKPVMRSTVRVQRPSTGIRASAFNGSRSTLVAKRASLRPQPKFVVKAAESETEVVEPAAEESFEDKLAKLKGSRRSGGGVKAAKRVAAQTGKDTALEEAFAPADMDFSGETVIYEGQPAVGDLVTNIALGFTLIWLPLTLASVGRYIWIKYKFTDKRIVVETTSPIDAGVTQIVYSQIRKVVTIGRGVGLWGDMVITLKNGDNVEFRSLEQYKELEKMINEKIGNEESKNFADPKGF